MSTGDLEYTKSLAESVTYKGIPLSDVPGMGKRISDLERQVAALRGLLNRALPFVAAYLETTDNNGATEKLIAEIQAALMRSIGCAGEAPMPEDVRKLVEAARVVIKRLESYGRLSSLAALAEALKPFVGEAGKNSGAEG